MTSSGGSIPTTTFNGISSSASTMKCSTFSWCSPSAGSSLSMSAPTSLAVARARVDEQPTRERRWALLALAQYQAGHQAAALRTIHEARGVLVRDLTELVPECLRVTAGTPEEVDRFLSVLEEVLAP